MRTCDEPGCDEKHLARNMCSRHYYRWRGDKKGAEQRPSCEVLGCYSKPDTRGLCQLHYGRLGRLERELGGEVVVTWNKAGWRAFNAPFLA